MEELQKLYDVLVRDGYYTNDFETFMSKWDDPEYKQKVYEVTSRDGLYTQDFESFNNKYQKKNRNLSKEDSISVTPEQNVELVSEDTSLGTPTSPINQPETLEGEGEIPTISIDKSQSNAEPTLDEKLNDTVEIDSNLFSEEQTKKISATTNRLLSSVSRIPQFIAEQVVTAFASDEQKQMLSKLTEEQRDLMVAQLYIGNPLIKEKVVELNEYGSRMRTEAAKIEDTLTKYNQGIYDDFKGGDWGRATARVVDEAVGSLPSIVQAMIPGVGIPSIILGSAAEKSRELQEEGDTLNWKTSANSIINGTAEGALEIITKNIGNKFFKSLIGKSQVDKILNIKEFGKQITKDFTMEGLSETATLAIQKMSDYLLNEDEDAFLNSFGEFVETFLIGGVATGPLSVGGTGINKLRQIVDNKKINKKISETKYDDLVSVFKNEDKAVDNMDDIVVSLTDINSSKAFLEGTIKAKVKKGEITLDEGNKIIENYTSVVESKRAVDGLGLPEEGKREAMVLVNEKDRISKEIADRDEALTAPKRERISDINKRLEEIARGENITSKDTEGETELTETEVTEPVVDEVVTETVVGEDTDLDVTPEVVTKEEALDIDSFFGDTVKENVNKRNQNLSINNEGVTEATPERQAFKNTLFKIADKAAIAVSKVIPETKIILHESNDQYLKYATQGPGRAEFNPSDNVIHVNLTEATKSTIPHEVFHAVFLNKVKTDKAAFKFADKMVSSVRRTLSSDNELAVAIDKFAARYTGEQAQFQNEERLAELVGLLSSKEFGYTKLSKSAKRSVIDFFKSIAKKFGIKLGSDFGSTDSSVIDLINTISRKTAEGEVITEEDVKILTPGTPIPGADGIIPSKINDDGPKINLSERSQLIDRRGVDESKIKRGSINDLSGTNAFVFAADQAVYGRVKSPTGLEYDFNGGFLYPYGAAQQGSNAVWVFSTEDAANKVGSKADNSDGVGLIMSQANDGITGNDEFYAYINAEVDFAIENGASPKEMISYINEKLKLTKVANGLAKKGLPAQISSLEELQTLLLPLNFEQRGSFTKTFLSKTSFDKFGIPPFNPLKTINQNISDAVTDPALSKVGYGDIISAIQFEKGGKPFKIEPGQPGYHPAYPWALPGSPIMVFDNAVDVRKVYPNSVPAGREKSAANPKGVNKTPLGQRTKPVAARSAMGGQYTSKIPSDIKVEGGVISTGSKQQDAPQSRQQMTGSVYFSNALKAIGNIKDTNPKQPVQWVRILSDTQKNGGVGGVNQELSWIGLEDYLNEWTKENKAKSVPKEVVEQYIDDNQIEIVDVSKSDTANITWKDDGYGFIVSEEYAYEIRPDYGKYELYRGLGLISIHDTLEEAKNKAVEFENKEAFNKVGGVKYANYTLEGGKNYQEVLLTLPQEKPASKYNSSHWDETNVLAHIRMNERVLPNGEKVMFIEEIQSDWAQEGKKRGFASNLFTGNFRKFVEEEKGLRLNEEELIAEFNNRQSPLQQEFAERRFSGKVPDMPYKKTDQWVGLAIRRVMKMAADKGFDRIAWVTGEQSAERYDISKQVGNIRAIQYLSGKWGLDGYNDGNSNFYGNSFNIADEIETDEIEDYVGKELAKRIINNKGRDSLDEFSPDFENVKSQMEYSGLDLKVGGEGMKTFYNSILPKVAKKEAQRFDKSAKVEVVEMNVATNKQLSIAITPKMKVELEEGIGVARQQKSVEDLKSGTMTTTSPIKIYKGIGGKKDISGQRINAHKGVVGIFSAIDKQLADEYGRDEGVAEIDLPKGTVFEVVEVDGKGLTPREYREAEVKAINNSDAQVVKLITIDGKVKGKISDGTGKQKQYIIKDFDLVKELTPEKRSARQQKTLEEAVLEARLNNFNEANIKDYLVRVKGYSSKEVDAALKIPVDAFTELPDSFKNIKGGLKDGVKLFNRVIDYRKKINKKNKSNTRLTEKELNKKVSDYIASQKITYQTTVELNKSVKKFKEKLISKNSKRKNPLPTAKVNEKVKAFKDAQILKINKAKELLKDKALLFEKNERRKNKRKAPLLSKQDIVDETIKFLEAQPEYKAEADTYTVGKEKDGTKETKYRKGLSTQQASMLSDLQKSVGTRPTEDMSKKIRMARIMLSQRAKGKRDLTKIKIELRNFMRKTLPKELYKQKDVLDLINKVTIASEKNIDNLYNEVTQLVTRKNVSRLSKSIKDILDGKYTKIQSGRLKGVKIDVDTKERIDNIKQRLAKKEMDANDIIKANEKLNKKYSELEKDPNQTDDIRSKMVDLEIIMDYNNSLLMDDNDLVKVQSLGSVDTALKQLVKFGRSSLKQDLDESHKEYTRQFEYVYEDVVGEPINMSDKNAKQKLNKAKRIRGNASQRKSVVGKTKYALNSIIENITNIFTSAESLDGLMDKISSLPGEMFGGRTQEIVTERVDSSSIKFKRRRMIVEMAIKSKLQDIYGKSWKKESRKSRVISSTGIYIDSKEVSDAKKAYKENPNSKTKKDLENSIIANELILSQNQMYYLYNQFKDPANLGSFANKYSLEFIEKNDNAKDIKAKNKINQDNAKRVMEELESKLTPEIKEFADWQVEEFFPELYDEYNPVYKNIYRTNMPWNEHYAGRIYREGVDIEPLDLLSVTSYGNTSVGSPSTMARKKNSLKIEAMDGTDALASYLNDMEYFAAYAETIRDIDKLFTNDYISSAITDIHGKKTMSLIKDSIQKIANKGTRNSLGDSLVNSMNTAFVLSRLGLSPVIAIKQLTSIFTYANDIGITKWLIYGAKNLTEIKKNWKEIRDNSVYMKDRKYDSILKNIESYSDSSMKAFIPNPTKEWLVNFMMYQVKWGDRTAIMLGGMPNYSYYKTEFKKKNPKATDQQAIDYAIVKFEKDTKRTQQSSDLQDKDLFQTGSPLTRSLNMFLTTPKQYLRKEIQAVRSLSKKVRQWDKKAGKGTRIENVRTLIMFHVFMPVLFQYISAGLPGLLADWEDEDEQDLIRAGVIGNLNALFITGEIVAGLGDYFTHKPWAGEGSKSLGVLNIVSGSIQKAKEARKAKDPIERAELWQEWMLELASVTGTPASTLNSFIENYSDIGTDNNLEKDILRMFNYSKYVIDGKKKDKSITVEEYNKLYK